MNDLAIYILLIFQFIILMMGFAYFFFRCQEIQAIVKKSDENLYKIQSASDRSVLDISRIEQESKFTNNRLQDHKEELLRKIELNDRFSQAQIDSLRNEFLESTFITVEQLEGCLFKQKKEILDEFSDLKSERDEKRWENLSKALSAPPVNKGVKF